MEEREAQWTRKGATLSDKTARIDYGLTQDEILQAISDGNFHHREGRDP